MRGCGGVGGERVGGEGGGHCAPEVLTLKPSSPSHLNIIPSVSIDHMLFLLLPSVPQRYASQMENDIDLPMESNNPPKKGGGGGKRRDDPSGWPRVIA